jgi:3-deoxy-D-manno-octulosonic-acid transferase
MDEGQTIRWPERSQAPDDRGGHAVRLQGSFAGGRAGVILYRFLLLTLAAPVWAGLMLWRVATGRESVDDLTQRLGGGDAPVARGPVVWLHAASVGEVTAARALAEALLARDVRLSLLVTASTTTGRASAAAWGHPRVTARLAPVDTRWAVLRLMSAWQPAALIIVENELWPNRIALAHTRRLPVLVAGARLSERSAARWRWLPGLAAAVLGGLDHAAAQDVGSARRLADLGLGESRLGPELNLKSLVQPPAPDPAMMATFAAQFPRTTTILAASTHAGEEQVVLAAFARARSRRPALRLILAPRHPARGDEVAALVGAAGLTMRRRSKGEAPGTAPVYLADTLGEMAAWYGLAGVTFVGGSLVDKGGHTPFEPAHAGSAILHGPYVANFARPYEVLADAAAARAVTDADSLAAAFLALTADDVAAAAQAARARTALVRLGTGSDGLDAFLGRFGELTAIPAFLKPGRR